MIRTGIYMMFYIAHRRDWNGNIKGWAIIWADFKRKVDFISEFVHNNDDNMEK